MTTEVGVPGKSIQYLNLHREGTVEDSFCAVDEQWTGPIVMKQSDYLVAISRFEVPLNRMPINREIKNAVQIFRYFDGPYRASIDLSADVVAGDPHNVKLPNEIPFDKLYDMQNDPPEAKDEGLAAEPCIAAANNCSFHNPEKMIANAKGLDNLTNGRPTDHVSVDEMETYLSNAETLNALNLTKLHPIDMPRCHTIYEFLQLLNSKIKDRLLYVDPNYENNANLHDITAYGNRFSDLIADAGNGRFNTFGSGDLDREHDENSQDPIAMFDIKMDSDYRFSVRMNSLFAATYYVKLHPELFKMFQFEEMNVNDIQEQDYNMFNGVRKPIYRRKYLIGRRFMGDRMAYANKDRTSEIAYANFKKLAKEYNAGYYGHIREIPISVPFDEARFGSPPAALRAAGQIVLDFYKIEEQIVSYTAPVSAADSINRVKALVFESSLPTKSEGSSGSSYQHFLTDYTIPTKSNFSWSPNSYITGDVNEEAASEVSFTNSNPSSGRLLILTDPSPLYELKLQVKAKCWHFEDERFYFEPIPLPPGSTFTCKIVFISKNQIYDDHSQRPELIHP